MYETNWQEDRDLMFRIGGKTVQGAVLGDLLDIDETRIAADARGDLRTSARKFEARLKEIAVTRSLTDAERAGLRLKAAATFVGVLDAASVKVDSIGTLVEARQAKLRPAAPLLTGEALARQMPADLALARAVRDQTPDQRAAFLGALSDVREPYSVAAGEAVVRVGHLVGVDKATISAASEHLYSFRNAGLLDEIHSGRVAASRMQRMVAELREAVAQETRADRRDALPAEAV